MILGGAGGRIIRFHAVGPSGAGVWNSAKITALTNSGAISGGTGGSPTYFRGAAARAARERRTATRSQP